MKTKISIVILTTCMLLMAGCNSKVGVSETPIDNSNKVIAVPLVSENKITETAKPEVNEIVEPFLLKREGFFKIRELDNEWEFPVSYQSLCEYSPLFEDEYIPDGVLMTVIESNDERFVTGFQDTVGYISIPGDMYVGKEIDEDSLEKVFGQGALGVSAEGHIYTYTWEEDDDYNYLEIQTKDDIISRIYFYMKSNRMPREGSKSYIPIKY